VAHVDINFIVILTETLLKFRAGKLAKPAFAETASAGEVAMPVCCANTEGSETTNSGTGVISGRSIQCFPAENISLHRICLVEIV